jgi:prepilin-type N-terminal cleavage/methylation domain-containing protein
MSSGFIIFQSRLSVSRWTRRGFTLAEVLIALALLVLVAALLLQLLIPTFRAASRGAVRIEMEQRALVALSRLASDLEESAPGATAVCGQPGGPVYVGAFRLAGIDPDGAHMWEREAVVWGWKGPGMPLVRKVWKPGGRPAISLVPLAEKAQRLSRSDMAAILNEAELPGISLAQNVVLFTVTDGEGNPILAGVPPLLTASLRIRKEAPTGRSEPEEYEQAKIIPLKNGT